MRIAPRSWTCFAQPVHAVDGPAEGFGGGAHERVEATQIGAVGDGAEGDPVYDGDAAHAGVVGVSAAGEVVVGPADPCVPRDGHGSGSGGRGDAG